MIVVEQDFEIGSIFKETLIPNAVKWFTGELSSEDSENEDNEFGEDEEEEDDEEDDEEDIPVRSAKKGHSHARNPKPNTQTATPPANPEQPPECKQQ